MFTKLKERADDQGLHLPKQVLDAAGIVSGEEVEVVMGNGQITIRKMKAKKFDLAEMVSRMPRGYRGNEDSFGAPAGKEQW